VHVLQNGDDELENMLFRWVKGKTEVGEHVKLNESPWDCGKGAGKSVLMNGSRVGKNCTYTPYINNAHLVISLHKTPYIHLIFIWF